MVGVRNGTHILWIDPFSHDTHCIHIGLYEQRHIVSSLARRDPDSQISSASISVRLMHAKWNLERNQDEYHFKPFAIRRNTNQSLHDSHFIIGVPSSGPLQMHHASCVLLRLDAFLTTGSEVCAFDFGEGCDMTGLAGAEDAEAEDGTRV